MCKGASWHGPGVHQWRVTTNRAKYGGAIEVVGEVAEAIPAGLIDLFSDEEEAAEG